VALGGRIRTSGLPENLGGRIRTSGLPENLGGRIRTSGLPENLGGRIRTVWDFSLHLKLKNLSNTRRKEPWRRNKHSLAEG